MTLESNMRKDLSKLLSRVPEVLAHEPIENGMRCGTPDYAYTMKGGVNGYIELKVCAQPKKLTSKINLRHWTKTQRKWMSDRLTCPTIFLIIRIGEYDYMFDTHTMFNLENMTMQQISDHPWKIKISDSKWWTFIELNKLSAKLKGTDKVKKSEDLHEF